MPIVSAHFRSLLNRTYEVSVGLLPHDSAERYDWADDSEEDEEDGS